MKESISYTYLLNMMLVFIVISFCVIAAVFSYSKAYRVNSKIASALEEAEGYNELSKSEITKIIRSFGYQQMSVNCRNREFPTTVINADGEKESTVITVSAAPDTQGYCLYGVPGEDANGDGKPDYHYYGITTYMMFDFPIINLLKIPVHNTTEKIYYFG